MPNNCMIIGCTHRQGKDGIKMFRIPSIRRTKGTKIEELTSRRQRLWLAAIKRRGFVDKETDLKSSHRVCSEHFVKGRPSLLMEETDPDWVPTLKLGYRAEETNQQNVRHQERKDALNAASALVDLSTTTSTTTTMDHDAIETEATTKPKKKDAETQTDVTIDQLDSLQEAFNAMQRELVDLRSKLSNVLFDEAKFKGNNERCNFYTGLSWENIIALVNFLSPAIFAGRNSLSKFQEVILVMMKLRLGLQTRLLCDIFSVDQATVSRIFLRVLNVMYHNLNFLIQWPEREALKLTTPPEFQKHFGTKVTVIIDCLEILIDRPNNLKARAQTYSDNKNGNTIKYLIGIAPQGAVTCISQGWGGRTPDNHIVENSDFLSKLEVGDVVLADRGFGVPDSVGLMCAEIEIPASTPGKRRLSHFDVESTRKLAHLKGHVERVMGSIRSKYTLLQRKLPLDYLITSDKNCNTLDKIVTVCACLVNLNQNVVPFP